MVLRSRSLPKRILIVCVNFTVIPQAECHQHLRLVFHGLLTWLAHFNYLSGKVSIRMGLLHRLQHHASQIVVRDIYLYCVHPVMEYASVARSGLSSTDAACLERCNRAVGRLTARICPLSCTPQDIILACAGLQSLASHQRYCLAIFTIRTLSA